MAYLQARAGIARAGVTYAGWVPTQVSVWIAGVDQTDHIEHVSFEIAKRANEPSTCTFTLNGVEPNEGDDVVVLRATPDARLFGGTLLQASVGFQGPSSDAVLWHCVADGYAWRLGRGLPITKSYRDVGVNTILGDILAIALFADTGADGYRVGYVPSTLGNIDIDFVMENVYTALTRLAEAAKATLVISPHRRVSLYVDSPAPALPTLINSSEIWDVNYERDLSQARTSLQMRCSKRPATALTGAVVRTASGATLDIDDTSEFSETGGGYALVNGRVLILYTGFTRPSFPTPPGNLSGPGTLAFIGFVDGEDIHAGDSVESIRPYFDSSAIAALSARLGGLSGVVTLVIDDVTKLEADMRGPQEIAQYGSVMKRLGYTTFNRQTDVGGVVTAAITSPVTISGDFKIQEVTIRPFTAIEGEDVGITTTVVAAPYLMQRQLAPLLSGLA